MKKLEAKDFVKINGGCFCYCLTEPFDRSMPTIFVDEVSNEDECKNICYGDRSLPYYGGGYCYDEMQVPSIPFNELSIESQNRTNYRNGGWKINYPNLFKTNK